MAAGGSTRRGNSAWAVAPEPGHRQGTPDSVLRLVEWALMGLVLLGLVVLVGIPASSDAASPSPSLSISPASGVVGTTVAVSGSNFGHTTVQLTWDGSATGMPSVSVGGNGSFRTTFTVRSAATGQHQVQAASTATVTSSSVGPGNGNGKKSQSATASAVFVLAATAAATPAPSATAAPAPTPTAVPIPTATVAPTATATPVATVAPTAAPTNAPLPTATPAPTPAPPTTSPACNATVSGFNDAAVQTASNRAGVNGTVCFPAGTYTGELNANISGQTYLASPGAKVTGPGVCMVSFASYVTIKGFEIFNCGTDGIVVPGGVSHVTILNNNIHDTTRGGIFADNRSAYVTIDGNTVTRTSGGYHGICAHGSPNARVTNNTVSNASGISIELWGGSSDGYVAGNTTYGGIIAISIDSSDRAVVESNRMTADPRDTQPLYNGLELVNTNDAIMRSNTVDGANHVLATGVAWDSAGTRSKVYGNTITRTTDNGLYVGWGGQGINPTYGLMDSNAVSSYSGRGIYLQGADNFTVTNNHMTNGAAGSQCIAVQIDPGLISSGNTCQ
jgi:parallel beta-helix repeat protein